MQCLWRLGRKRGLFVRCQDLRHVGPAIKRVPVYLDASAEVDGFCVQAFVLLSGSSNRARFVIQKLQFLY